MLTVLATNSSSTITLTSRRGSTRVMFAASPSPVTRPIRAQMDWIAVISG